MYFRIIDSDSEIHNSTQQNRSSSAVGSGAEYAIVVSWRMTRFDWFVDVSDERVSDLPLVINLP